VANVTLFVSGREKVPDLAVRAVESGGRVLDALRAASDLRLAQYATSSVRNIPFFARETCQSGVASQAVRSAQSACIVIFQVKSDFALGAQRSTLAFDATVQ
jgi:hypothetical protein